MTTSLNRDTSDQDRTPGIDIGRWAVIAAIIVLSLIVLNVVRSQIVAPFDSLVTEQMCLRHGEELERVLVDFGRSNRLALTNRADGYCSYGPGPDGEPAMTVPIDETDPGALYRWAKIIGIILQLGVVSFFIRLVTEPALQAQAFLARRLRN